VQLRYETGLTSSEYVSSEAWRDATLERCPLHQPGDCSFRRHGTYERMSPPGARVARWYCPHGHETFSLLPDCLAARFPGALVDLEMVVAHTEQATSVEAAANALRTDDIGLVCAMRWVVRRREAVHANLIAVKGLEPELFVQCTPTVADFRRGLGTDRALEALRDIAAEHLHALVPPLGFAPRRAGGGDPKHRVQHPKGPDPPRRSG